jgi:hypothetical protein
MRNKVGIAASLVGLLTLLASTEACFVTSDGTCEQVANVRRASVSLPAADLCAEGRRMYALSGYAGAVNGDLDMDWCRRVCGDPNVTGCELPEPFAYTRNATCPYTSDSDGGPTDQGEVSCAWVTYYRTKDGCDSY